MQSAITIRCLGNFEVVGLPAPPRGRKQTALLAYLASNLGRPCSRAALASVFWGDRFDEQARQSLRQALSALGKAFKACPGSLHIDRQSARLDPAKVGVDIIDAKAALEAGNLEHAATLFRQGAFLDAFAAKETGLSDWLAGERAKWAELARQAILDRAEQLMQESYPVAAEEMAVWLLKQDLLDEAALRLAMRAKAASGSMSGAVRLYSQFESNLRDELGVGPARETVECLEGVRRDNGGRSVSLISDPVANDPRPRVMVLPFTDTNAGLIGSAIADSLTDEVIAALGRFPELAVTGRNTSIVYRDRPRDMESLVRDLDIQYVISGTVRRLGDRLRIGIELDDAVARQFVSAERRDCRIDDFYDVQEDLARAIAGAMEPELISATAKKFARRPFGSLALWEKALVAGSYLERGSRESLLTAESMANEILESNPKQLLALKVLAIVRYALTWNFWTDDLIATARSSAEIAEKVLELDPFDADALSIAARGNISLKRYDRALQLAEYSVEMNPSNAQSHIHLSSCYTSMGRYHEALDHIAEARRISPNDRLVAYWDCAESYARFGLSRFDDVIRIAGASASKPGTWAWTRFILTAALVQIGRLDEAVGEVKKIRRDHPDVTCENIRALLKPQFDPEFTKGLRAAGLPEK